MKITRTNSGRGISVHYNAAADSWSMSAVRRKAHVFKRTRFYVTDVVAYGSGGKKFFVFVIVLQFATVQA